MKSTCGIRRKSGKAFSLVDYDKLKLPTLSAWRSLKEQTVPVWKPSEAIAMHIHR